MRYEISHQDIGDPIFLSRKTSSRCVKPLDALPQPSSHGQAWFYVGGGNAKVRDSMFYTIPQVGMGGEARRVSGRRYQSRSSGHNKVSSTFHTAD